MTLNNIIEKLYEKIYDELEERNSSITAALDIVEDIYCAFDDAFSGFHNGMTDVKNDIAEIKLAKETAKYLANSPKANMELMNNGYTIIYTKKHTASKAEVFHNKYGKKIVLYVNTVIAKDTETVEKIVNERAEETQFSKESMTVAVLKNGIIAVKFESLEKYYD